jgi:E3 ubiquitin-protein ligase HECTD2
MSKKLSSKPQQLGERQSLPSELPLPQAGNSGNVSNSAFEGSLHLHPGQALNNVGRRSGPQYLFDEEPILRPNPDRTPSKAPRSNSSSHGERPYLQAPPPEDVLKQRRKNSISGLDDDSKKIFKQLEDYIVDSFGSLECINNSFAIHQTRPQPRPRNGSITRKPVPIREPTHPRPRDASRVESPPGPAVTNLDPKMLLLGDFVENGTWWTGGSQNPMPPPKTPTTPVENNIASPIITKPSQVNWKDIEEWYRTVVNSAEGWFGLYEEMVQDSSLIRLTEREMEAMEQDMLRAQDHVQRVLLKATEMLLKRPGRPLSDPGDIRFLLVLVENPLLHTNPKLFRGFLQPGYVRSPHRREVSKQNGIPSSGLLSGQHSGIIKRIIGLLSNSSTQCHSQFINWAANYPVSRFGQTKDLFSGFLTYRMLRQNEKKQKDVPVDITAGLIPQMPTGRSGAYLYEEIGTSSSTKKPKEQTKKSTYMDDWQVKAACRVLSLLFAANNLGNARRPDEGTDGSYELKGLASRDAIHTAGQMLPTSDFYNSMIDNIDLVADFEAWESKRNCFSFCQYPFLLSIWAKTKVLEYDAHRQMQMKARDAWFDSIMNQRKTTQYLSLTVRRDCLVEDSLTAVSEVIGSGSEDVKKRLRIAFRGEEGIDAGGLRKEWFLLLIREVFNPDHGMFVMQLYIGRLTNNILGMFVYDEDSQFCYFNPNSLEAPDQFFLVGVVMGLAIYNSTILDVALPPVAFRKLLASAPTHGVSVCAHPRPALKYTLEDLAEYQPRLARGLKQLLEYDGDVETAFSLDFVVENARYGASVQVPLCPNGERKPVTNGNRREYVDLYVRHVLDTSVTRQFEPFKRGFYTVCGGNAFSLFRPEEIELLVRGSDEPLDIASLRAVAEYDGWTTRRPDGVEPVVSWFWETFQQAKPSDQRKMLLFITGSDRIPATGATTLHIKVSCLGDDCGRYPIARTCFNLLSLWKYASRQKLESMLWRAVWESEGFGIK